MKSENPSLENFLRLISAAVLTSVILVSSSCVPLLVGGVVGYVAHAEGFGVVEPLDSGGSRTYETPAYEDTGGYDTGAYDEPVY